MRKYLRSPGIPAPAPRQPRPSALNPYKDYLRVRLADGMDNCVVLLRELQARGYTGRYSILKDYVRPFRQRLAVVPTRRFETAPGEQAQVDFGEFRYVPLEGSPRLVWGFTLVLSWSRALYVEFVRRADVATFIQCHLNAFEYLGGYVGHRCQETPSWRRARSPSKMRCRPTWPLAAASSRCLRRIGVNSGVVTK